MSLLTTNKVNRFMKEKINRKLVALDVELHLDLEEVRELYKTLERYNLLCRGLSPLAHDMRDKLVKILKDNDPNF